MIDISAQITKFEEIFTALGEIPTKGNDTRLMARIFDSYEQTVKELVQIINEYNNNDKKE